MTAGPMEAIAALLPTNNPAPMIPPMEIIATWRDCSVRLSPIGSGISSDVVLGFNSQARIPLIAAIFPEPAFAAAHMVESIDRLDAGDVFGVLVADLALHPEAER